MKTKFEKRAILKVDKGSAFKIETADHLPALHQMLILNGKRGSGKSVAATNLLRMYKQTGTMDRILFISPTFNSNKQLMKDLDIDDNDVFQDPDDPNLISNIIDIVNDERDEYLKYQHLKSNYKKIMKSIKNGTDIVEDMDEYLLAYYNINNNTFNHPKPRYPRYDQNKPGIISLFIDDCLCSKLFTNRRFVNLITRHRHLGDFPEGGAVGLTIIIAIQNYKASSGSCPKSVRNNAVSLCLFKTKDESELKQIAESFSGEIPTEKFIKLYENATEEDYSFLFVDLHKKKNQPSMFRKRFDTYLLVDEDSDDETLDEIKSRQNNKAKIKSLL